MKKKGTLVVLEGLDGSGKTTQSKILLDKLREDNKNVTALSYPDYGQPSSALVKMYLGGEFGESADAVGAYGASAFYAVDRYASWLLHWRDKYGAGGAFFSARYTTSNLIYQTAKLPRADWDGYIEWLCDFEYKKLGIPEPDRVIFLDMPAEISMELLERRYSGDGGEKDLHERDVEYLVRCREAAEYIGGKQGWIRISCAEGGKLRTIEAIAQEIYANTVGIL